MLTKAKKDYYRKFKVNLNLIERKIKKLAVLKKKSKSPKSKLISKKDLEMELFGSHFL